MKSVFAVFHQAHDGCANPSNLVDLFAVENDAILIAATLEDNRDPEYQEMDSWYVVELTVN